MRFFPGIPFEPPLAGTTATTGDAGSITTKRYCVLGDNLVNGSARAEGKFERLEQVSIKHLMSRVGYFLARRSPDHDVTIRYTIVQ
jgi:hypothetical protein